MIYSVRGGGLAFVGPLRSGKSTMATEFVRRHAATRCSFADPLKDELAFTVARNMEEFTQFRNEMSDTEQKHRWRLGLQWYGTEFRRARFGENYWVKKMEDLLDSVYCLAVIDDCRFPNEYEMLLERGFVFVLCEPEVRISAEHSSEEHWKGFKVDFVLPWSTITTRFGMLEREGLL